MICCVSFYICVRNICSNISFQLKIYAFSSRCLRHNSLLYPTMRMPPFISSKHLHRPIQQLRINITSINYHSARGLGRSKAQSLSFPIFLKKKSPNTDLPMPSPILVSLPFALRPTSSSLHYASPSLLCCVHSSFASYYNPLSLRI